ncbi:citrate lyase subunit gamma (acyl carrier protein) [Candidatus Phytoplasma luffae]|uniref:Citrate lyase subunit gamma (Acyl carrier protein) n=1 Tax=Loofah witches'-broom phytoplasma TaxID=35773 RepID=A0A975FIS9_LOWBP|nr:citrate lyase acyl carrier protein [Candidatus Phytoplasma luffae]QTX02694.1 citrate lyase subunit gamma (acyl carrier protein) [Candidatus Phytoplasma luffae]
MSNNYENIDSNKIVFCGSLESSDCLVTIEPNNDNKVNISIESPFIRQFGKRIKKLCLDILQERNITTCNLVIQDQGAIDEVIKSRIVTALDRLTKNIEILNSENK